MFAAAIAPTLQGRANSSTAAFGAPSPPFARFFLCPKSRTNVSTIARRRGVETPGAGVCGAPAMERSRPVDPAEAENGKKLQQSGGAGPVVSSGGEYTHGGVKKTKFEPKVPTRRLKKLSASSSAKSELPGEGLGGGEIIPKELQRLLQQQGESDGRGRDHRSHQRISKVAFGFGGFPSRSSSPSGTFPNRGSSGSAGVGTASHSVGVPDNGPGASWPSGPSGSNESCSRIPSRVVEKDEFMQADGMLVDFPKKAERVEVFDQEKYFPVTLPLRKPVAGVDTRRLDEDEFGEDEVQEEDNEDEAAEELGLTDPTDADTLFFFQFPKGLPLSLNPSGKEKKPKPSSARLEDLGKGGAMGKLLVYESGAVKFKIGDVVFDALPGTECTFAQEVAAVNTTTKHCSFVGGVHKRVVLTPDIVNVLPDLTDLRPKP